MAQAISLRVDGLQQAIAQMKAAGGKVTKQASGFFRDAADSFAGRAKRDAPVDDGFLKNSINVDKANKLDYKVRSQAAYSAYIEFGTGLLVQIPAGLEDYASQFRGPAGGSGFDEFFLKILDWVHRKRLSGRYSVKTQRRLGNKSTQFQEDYDVAFMIALKILKVGVRPHPYFFKQASFVEKELLRELKTIKLK